MATAKQIAWRKKFVKRYGGKKKKSSRKKSMGTGDLSEEYYAERLRKKLGEKSLVFRTGKARGVPDIAIKIENAEKAKAEKRVPVGN